MAIIPFWKIAERIFCKVIASRVPTLAGGQLSKLCQYFESL